MIPRRGFPILLGFAFLTPGLSARQIGGTADIITGTVISADGTPLADVTIEAFSLETEITRRTSTDQLGRYSILFPDGGGQYTVRARLIGMVPQEATIARYADEDRLVWNLQMSSQAVMLDEIVVQGFLSPVRIQDLATPGDESRNITPDLVAGLPLDADDLNLLATLIPGVVGVGATDSTPASYSVAGQRPDANELTLDGMSFRSGSVPQEGLRSTRVITSTYDVSRGRFSGGLISSTSRSGTNSVQGTANYAFRDDALAIESGDSPFTSAFTQHQLSGGIGGPMLRNRLFGYASFQGRFRTDPLRTLTSATATDLERLGVSPDSVSRFVNVVDQLGAGGTRDASDRNNNNLSGMVRLDFLVSNDHTLTVRGDVRGANQDPTQIGQLALPETGGSNESGGNGVMASLTSRMGLHYLNQVRAYASNDNEDGSSYLILPSGQVRVASALDDGATGIGTLTMGGNTRMPATARTSTMQLSEELSWLPGSGAHRVRLGAVLTAERSDNLRSANQFGTYTFNSLTDLEAGTAASFRRTIAPNERTSHSQDLGAYLGDVWRASPTLQLTYGVRAEGTRLTVPPAYNPAIETSFGRRTDVLPSELAWSPRAGFSWTVGGGAGGFGSPPLFIVRGGAGIFRNAFPTALIGLAQNSNGLLDSEAAISCIGPEVPAPNWGMFAGNQATIPVECVGAPSTVALGRAPGATVFSEGFQTPKAFNTSLSVQRNLTRLLRLSLEARYARGYDQYGFSDLNLNTTPRFALAGEAGRPVFVDAGLIDQRTGSIDFNDSRLDPAYGEVLEIGSDLESDTRQLTVSLSGVTSNGVVLQTSYTWSRGRDQSSSSARFGGTGLGSNTTGGNPNEREWARGSFERRHAFLSTIRYPFGTDIELTAIGRMTSGTPYTPMVGNDVNGDGARNDRAFVFDPATATDPVLAADVTRLLDRASGGARDCLLSQLGMVAERNSCLGPWEPSLDLQFNYRPNVLGLRRNLSISLSTSNLLRGVDELIHGPDNARGWGLQARPDTRLLFANGFDPVAQAYTYQVNERFGDTQASANAFRNPFQLSIQARWNFGPDRGRAALDRIRGAGGGRGGPGGGAAGPGAGGRGGFAGGGGGGGLRDGGGVTPADFLQRFLALLPNPAGAALEMSDSLGLGGDQRTRLGAVRDSLMAQNEVLARELQADLEALGTNQDQRASMALIRPATAGAQQNLRLSLAQVRQILSAEQWAMLPEQVRNSANGRRRRGNQ